MKKHRTPLHEIIHTYRLKLKEMEKIETTMMGPKWQPSFDIHIPAQEEQAIKESETDLSDIRIFSDGSCIEGHVGTAAVLYKNGVEKGCVRLYIGTEDEHIVLRGGTCRSSNRC